MPFHDLIIRRPGVLSGRISKPQFPTLGRQCNILRGEKLSLKPQVTSERPRQSIQVKTEPTDDYETYEPRIGVVDSSFSGDREQSNSSDYEYSDDEKETILPSIERSPSPEYPVLPPQQRELYPFLDLINSLRGGDIRARKRGRSAKGKQGKATRPSTGPVVSLDKAVKFPASYVSNLEWDIPKDVESDYEKLKKANKGSTRWTASEAELHKILSLRGHHPLMPGQWKQDFVGINLEEILFTPLDCQIPPVLRNISSGLNAQFRATKALTGIFALSSRVGDHLKYSERGGEKAAKLIEAEIGRYLAWAKRDAGLQSLEYAPNIGVHRIHKPDGNLDDLIDEMDSLMHEWTTGYLEWYRKHKIKEVPQTLFGLFIMQHLVLVLTTDVTKPELPARCMAQLDLSRSDNRWLDHALSLAIPINMARDIKACEVIGNSKFSEADEVDGSDPDA